MCGKKPGWASLGLPALLWQGEAGVPALVPTHLLKLLWDKVLLLEGGTGEKAVPSGSLLLPAGILDLRLNCSGTASSLTSEEQHGIQVLVLVTCCCCTRRPNLYKCGLGPIPSKQKESELGPQSGPTRVFKTQSPATSVTLPIVASLSWSGQVDSKVPRAQGQAGPAPEE